MDIRKKITEIMTEKGISYAELARSIGWSRQNLWMKLNNENQPNFENIRKIIDALGMEIKFASKDAPDEFLSAERLYEATDEQVVSFEVVESIVNSMGYVVVIFPKEINAK